MNAYIQKIAVILVLSLFIMGMLPAAFADSNSGSNSGKGKMPQAETVPAEMAEIAPPLSHIQISDSAVKPLKLFKELRETEDEIEKIRSEHDIAADIASLKDAESFNQGKAFTITKYASLIVHRLMEKLESVEARMQNADAFLETHPDALDRLAKIKAQLRVLDDKLDTVMEDNALTREEWTTTVVPTLKQIRKVIKELGVKHQGFFNEWRKHHSQDTAQKIAMKLEEKQAKMREKMLKQMSESEVDMYMRTIADELKIIKEAGKGQHNADVVKKSLEKIKDALKGKNKGKMMDDDDHEDDDEDVDDDEDDE